MREELLDALTRDEGFRSAAYQDSRGYWTIGYGRLIDGRLGGGISKPEAEALLDNDVSRVLQSLGTHLAWWTQLNEPRQVALANMAFNMGLPRLEQFHDMLRALQAGDWQKAHDEALNSAWAHEVGARAQRIARQFLTGEYQS